MCGSLDKFVQPPQVATSLKATGYFRCKDDGMLPVRRFICAHCSDNPLPFQALQQLLAFLPPRVGDGTSCANKIRLGTVLQVNFHGRTRHGWQYVVFLEVGRVTKDVYKLFQ